MNINSLGEIVLHSCQTATTGFSVLCKDTSTCSQEEWYHRHFIDDCSTSQKILKSTCWWTSYSRWTLSLIYTVEFVKNKMTTQQSMETKVISPHRAVFSSTLKIKENIWNHRLIKICVWIMVPACLYAVAYSWWASWWCLAGSPPRPLAGNCLHTPPGRTPTLTLRSFSLWLWHGGLKICLLRPSLTHH